MDKDCCEVEAARHRRRPPRLVPKKAKSTVLSIEEEAIIVAFRRHTLLPLDDCLYALQPTIPHLTRSALHRCLQRHGISRLPEVEGSKPAKKKFKTYPIGYFHIDIAEVQTAEGGASTSTSPSIAPASLPSCNWSGRRDGPSAAAFLEALIAAVPYQNPHGAHRQWHPVYLPAALR